MVVAFSFYNIDVQKGSKIAKSLAIDASVLIICAIERLVYAPMPLFL